MAFTDGLLDLFTRTVTIEALASRDVAGKPTYGPAVEHPARIEMKSVGVRTIEGTVIVGRGRLWIPYAAAITTGDRITLPADMGPVNPPILSVSVVDDDLGASYTALIIG